MVSTDFQPITKVFPLNHLLRTVHDGHCLMHRESFPVNSAFCTQPQKFSHLKVLPYTVLINVAVMFCVIAVDSLSEKSHNIVEN